MSATWSWSGTSTTIKLYVNGVEQSSAVFEYVFLEDGIGYATFWGAQQNHNADGLILEDAFSGFIYEISVANYAITDFSA